MNQLCRRASCWLCLSLGAPEDDKNHTHRYWHSRCSIYACPAPQTTSGMASELRLQLRVSGADTETHRLRFKLGGGWRLRHILQVNLGRLAA